MNDAMNDAMNEPIPSPSLPPHPMANRIRNVLILLAAIVLSVVLFFGVQGHGQKPALGTLAAAAVPLDEALHNGKPTLVEFYADWCTTCQAMAPDLGALEQEYAQDINFVMLNVDNPKWLPELTQFQVDGIPHFVFMDGSGTVLANAIGLQPKPILAADLDALSQEQSLPFQAETGRSSAFRPAAVTAAGANDPRSHGGQPAKQAP